VSREVVVYVIEYVLLVFVFRRGGATEEKGKEREKGG
jgi:hypothetical protein